VKATAIRQGKHLRRDRRHSTAASDFFVNAEAALIRTALSRGCFHFGIILARQLAPETVFYADLSMGCRLGWHFSRPPEALPTAALIGQRIPP
jgi:hypothetical protein